MDTVTQLPDGSGCFTATILSEDEAMALPIKQRPLNHRISSEMYHAVFESIGHASTTWNTGAGNEVFDSEAASKIAVDLCFKIANEAERWRELSATEVCAGNPAIAEYVASLESRLARMTDHYNILRADLVEREARDLYGGFQAAANYKDLDTCRTIANARLRGTCSGCEGRGEVGGQFPDGSYQTDPCPHCDGAGFVPVEGILNHSKSPNIVMLIPEMKLVQSEAIHD